MVEIKWAEETHLWLRDIHDYIATDNPDTARKIISGIYEKAQVLRSFSEIGHKYHTETEGELPDCMSSETIT